MRTINETCLRENLGRRARNGDHVGLLVEDDRGFCISSGELFSKIRGESSMLDTIMQMYFVGVRKENTYLKHGDVISIVEERGAKNKVVVRKYQIAFPN